MATISTEQLVEDYYSFIFNMAYKLTSGDEQEAQDLTQEAFYKALRALPGLVEHKGTHAYGGWLITILKRTWIDWGRRQKFVGSLSEEQWETLPDECTFEDEVDKYEPLKQVLAQFTEEEQQILFLRSQGVSVLQTWKRCGTTYKSYSGRYRYVHAVEQTARKWAQVYG